MSSPFWEINKAREKAISLVLDELTRQLKLKKSGKFPRTCEDLADYPYEALPILLEEVGEVARAMNDSNEENFKEELVQVAAVAIAWLAGLEERDLINARYKECDVSDTGIFTTEESFLHN